MQSGAPARPRSCGSEAGSAAREDALDEVALQIGDQPAERADRRRDDRGTSTRRYPELARQEAAEHRPGATKGHQREIAQVDAIARDELVDLDEHLGDGDGDDRLGGLPPALRPSIARRPPPIATFFGQIKRRMPIWS